MKNHDCNQEPTIHRIEAKLDSIDKKLDDFLGRITVTETKLGFISTGFAVLLAPIIVGIVIFLFAN